MTRQPLWRGTDKHHAHVVADAGLIIMLSAPPSPPLFPLPLLQLPTQLPPQLSSGSTHMRARARPPARP